MERKEHFREFIRTLPSTPGVYRYYDKLGNLLYIGKAKSLKNRVSSYFFKQHYESFRTRKMVENIARIEYTLVDTEMDALLLENLLIKQHKPKYNISLKDDKSYPYIKITAERFPKVFATRQYIKDGSEYLGPYASVGIMHTLLNLVKSLYPLRNCNLQLSEKNILQGKFSVCMEYQIGNCKGPCTGLQTEDEYMESVSSVKNILRGNIHIVLQHIKDRMQHASDKLAFEEAYHWKQKYDELKAFQARSTIVSRDIHNLDVFSIATDQDFAFVNFMRVMNGMIIQTQTLELRKRMDETDEDLLLTAIGEVRNKYGNTTSEIVLPIPVSLEDNYTKITIPQAGDKKKLLELSLKNVFYFRREKLIQYEKLNPEFKTERVLMQMQKDLRLPQKPFRIECFDNSNLQGTFPVSAMVCFIEAKPFKKDYRHFNIQSVQGPDDFATMKEAVHRRYSGELSHSMNWPDLIVVDGGKGQLGAALEVLIELKLEKKIPIIGIAKKLEEIYIPGDEIPLYIDKKSETLKVIQRMRDEAHRFGITHHRKKRMKGTIKTELENISGIGKKLSLELLRNFGNIQNIKNASLVELERIVGKSKAITIKNYFGN